VEKSEGFTRKNEDGREADFRLANHRLQPLGHLTATRNLSIRHALGYGDVVDGQIVPRIVPASSQDSRVNPPRISRRAHQPEGSGSCRRQPCQQPIGTRDFTRMSRRPNIWRSRAEDANRAQIRPANSRLAGAGLSVRQRQRIPRFT